MTFPAPEVAAVADADRRRPPEDMDEAVRPMIAAVIPDRARRRHGGGTRARAGALPGAGPGRNEPSTRTSEEAR